MPRLAFDLAKRAKLTDVLSQVTISACGHLISDRFGSLLSGFKIHNPHYYPVTVNAKDGEHAYSFLQVLPIDMAYIDFPRTKFQWEREFEDGEFVEIKNVEEYLSLNKTIDILSAINAKEIHLAKPIPYDMFTIDFSKARGCIISEKLKRAIEDAKITGAQLAKFDLLEGD